MIDPITALAAVSSAVNLVKKAVKTVQDVQSLGPVLGQYFDAKAQAIEVVEKAKAVLRVINERSLGSWPSDADWGRLLPSWFVERCEPVKSEAESQAWLAWWRGLSDDQMADVERNQAWTLDGWLYSLTPDQRRWFWWDAVPLTEHNFVVAVEAHEWPFPSGALGWLLRASGADRVEAEV